MSTHDLAHSATDLDALTAAASGFGGGSARALAGLPDPAMLTTLANAFFAAFPGQSIATPAGPSLSGLGASPIDVLGSAAPHLAAAATSSLPIAASPAHGASPATVSPLAMATPDNRALDAPPSAALSSAPSLVAGTSAPGFGSSPTELTAHQGVNSSFPNAAPVSSAQSNFGRPQSAPFQDASVLDLSSVYALSDGSNSPLPTTIEAGPSLSGFGDSRSHTVAPGVSPASADRGSLPGLRQEAAPQPPPANPPPQILTNHAGIDTPQSGGTTNRSFPTLALPFEAELRALLAPLAGEPVAASGAPHASTLGSPFYFLDSRASQHTEPGAASNQDFDVHAVRRDFPILQETVNGRPLIWFDNAATTQKPRQVINRIAYFYEHENSNIHRAAHELAARATDAYEGARTKVARFLNAPSTETIIFTRGATEAINLVAATYGLQHVGAGDEIVITNLEHHANIVPWQQLCLSRNAKLRVAPVDDRGELMIEEFGKLLNARTKLVAFTQVSNALGTITPAKAIVEMAHRVGARVLVDGAQSVSHMKVDVQDLDADFFVFSGHKLFAPTGIGVLYAKKDIMDALPPYQTGGNMIRDVRFERTEFHESPMRFEAGTGNIADAVGLGAAIDYVEKIGLNVIADYEHKLLVYATERLLQIPNLRIIGTAREKASVISLVITGIPSEEIGARLNKHGVAVRSGHHCAQPILRRFGQETTVRPSFAFYNTCGEIDVMVAALADIQAQTGLPRA